MTLFLLIGIPLIIFYATIATLYDFVEGFVLVFIFYSLLFALYSGFMARNHFDLISKPVQIQKLILKGGSVFILYLEEGKEEEKAENRKLILTDKPSYVEVKIPRESKWYFWNMAPNTETLKISKEDFKKFL
jgi:hypothetical protein